MRERDLAGPGAGATAATPAAMGTSSGTFTVTVAPGSVTGTVTDHSTNPAALAVTTCLPGSTGIAVPHAPRPRTFPLRVTTRPGASFATPTMTRDRRGSSSACRLLASTSSCARRDWMAAVAASPNSDHALAMRPARSKQSARFRYTPDPG